MAKFKYTARVQTGELQTGFVESENREGASAILSGHGLLVLSVESAGEKKWYDPFLDLFKRVKSADLMIFTRQFATLLDAKIPMADALKNLYRQTRNPVLKEAVLEVSSDVDSGLSRFFPNFIPTWSAPPKLPAVWIKLWFFWRIIWKKNT